MTQQDLEAELQQRGSFKTLQQRRLNVERPQTSQGINGNRQGPLLGNRS